MLSIPTTTATTARLERRVPELMAKAGVPGLSLALVHDGGSVWCRAFGVRSVATGARMTTDTVLEAASLSKPVFAYAALKLVDRGILKLDAPLAGYLPEPYIQDDPQLPLVTARHVLSHATGLPNWADEPSAARVRFMPGERWSYSGLGFLYLQKVVEQLTGRPAEEYLRTSLLDPLGLRSASFTWTAESPLRVAQGHDAEGQPVEKAAWPQMLAACSLHCTAADFARFMVATMQPPSSGPLRLRPALARDMLTPQMSVNDGAPWAPDWPRPEVQTSDVVFWGLGWGLQHHAGGSVSFWHWGDNSCFTAFALGFPAEGVGIVMMANSANGLALWRDVLVATVEADYPAVDWLEGLYRQMP